MIIFDLDGTLADCEHRRHFVDPSKRSDCYYHEPSDLKQMEGWYYLDDVSFPKSRVPFKQDRQSFYDACDKDVPIKPVFNAMRSLDVPYEIWSGRCESVRKKTEDWLCQFMARSEMPTIRMRPIDNTEPDEVLKERWLDEYISSMWPRFPPCNEENNGKIFYRKDPIELVFDSHHASITMWRRRGIFVFNCNQHDKDF